MAQQFFLKDAIPKTADIALIYAYEQLQLINLNHMHAI